MNVFEFDNYKDALKLFLKKKNTRGASKDLANYLGVHPTLVSQVLAGAKDFTAEQLLSVCNFLGVPNLESKYLLTLVQIERAGSRDLKNHFIELKEQIRKQALQVSERVQRSRQLTESEQAIFYSNWAYSAIHVMTTLEQAPNFDDICQKLGLSRSRARDMIEFLKQIQMIRSDNGKLVAEATTTHLEKASPYLLRHHTNWRLKAIAAAEELTDDELIYTANFSVSKKDFKVLREEFLQMIQRFVKVVEASPAEDIAQFNLDFFWIKK